MLCLSFQMIITTAWIAVIYRCYLYFARLYVLNQATSIFSVTPAKPNTLLRRIYSAPVDRSTGIICDQTAALTGITIYKDYPEHFVSKNSTVSQKMW